MKANRFTAALVRLAHKVALPKFVPVHWGKAPVLHKDPDTGDPLPSVDEIEAMAQRALHVPSLGNIDKMIVKGQMHRTRTDPKLHASIMMMEGSVRKGSVHVYPDGDLTFSQSAHQRAYEGLPSTHKAWDVEAVKSAKVAKEGNEEVGDEEEQK